MRMRNRRSIKYLVLTLTCICFIERNLNNTPLNCTPFLFHSNLTYCYSVCMLRQERQEGGGGSPRVLAEKLLSSDLQKLLAARPASPPPPPAQASRSFARPGQPSISRGPVKKYRLGSTFKFRLFHFKCIYIGKASKFCLAPMQ